MKKHQFYFQEESSKKVCSYLLLEACDEYIKNLTFQLYRENGYQTQGDTIIEGIKLLIDKYGIVPERPDKLKENSKKHGKLISEGKKK